MISGLLVLNSSYVGSRDLWWPQDPGATLGYNVYRASDYPINWVKLNTTPQPGQFYRDMTLLQSVTYTVTDNDWVEKGTFGKWGFRIPDIPYSSVVQGRPMLANSPNDVTLLVNGNPSRPALVSGTVLTVWLRVDDALPVGGAVSAFPLIDFANLGAIQATYNKLINCVDIYLNMSRTFYTVVPVGADGEVHPPGAPGSDIKNSLEVDRMDYMLQEMVRRNTWMFEYAGEPAWLMFRKTRGVRCGCIKNGLDQPRSGCPSCFETGFVGGYFGPYDFPFIDPDTATNRIIDEGGQKVERQSMSFLGPTPIVQAGDLIIRVNGERLVIGPVNYKMPRGVLVQQEFSVELLRPKDTRYLIPINPGSPQPVIFNPKDGDPLDGQGGSAPIFTKEPDLPAVEWENPDQQPGRTITWGNIHS